MTPSNELTSIDSSLGSFSVLPREIISECITPYFEVLDFKAAILLSKKIAKIVGVPLARRIENGEFYLAQVFCDVKDHPRQAIAFAQRHRFKHIDLTFFTLKHIHLEQLFTSPDTKSVHIHTDRIYNFSASSTNLESLSCRSTYSTEIHTTWFLTFPRLTSLKLNFMDIQPVVINQFSLLTSLTSFHITARLTNQFIHAFNFTRLTSLSLWDGTGSCWVDQSGIESLSRFTNLLELNFGNIKKLDPTIFERFKHLTKLKRLNLYHSSYYYPQQLLPYIKALTNLEQLGIDAHAFVGEGLKQLLVQVHLKDK